MTDSTPSPTSSTPRPGAKAASELLTDAEMQRRQQENLLAVFNRTGWRVKGADGPAEFLGLKPTTLLARMKKMGIEKAGTS